MTFVVPFSEPTPMHQVEDLTEDLVATQEELSSQQLAQQKDHQQRQAKKKNRLFVWKSLKLKSEAFSIPKGLFPGFQLLLWSCLGDFTSLFFEGENSDGCTGVPVLVATWESLAFLFISLRLMPPAFAGLEIASSMARSTTKSSSSNNSTILSIASSMARSTTKSNSNSSNNQQQQ